MLQSRPGRPQGAALHLLAGTVPGRPQGFGVGNQTDRKGSALHLLADTVQFVGGQHVLFLNSAGEVGGAMNCAPTVGTITLAEDNVAALNAALQRSGRSLRHVPFHEYTLCEPAATMDVAVMNIVYQPNSAWIVYGLNIAAYALKAGGRLYVEGAKERGIMTVAKRMQALFGNVETLAISKGQRVISSFMSERGDDRERIQSAIAGQVLLGETIFAQGEIDEGTRLLLDALGVRADDEALDIGCGAGHIGLYVARQASQGFVTMVDVSLLAVSVAQKAVDASGMSNIQVQPSDGIEAVRERRFDLVVTNPPFHAGGVQTKAIAERFIRGAAQVLRPRGRFYLVANRFLKYEPVLHACFREVEEVGGNTRFKVLCMRQAQ